MAAYGLSACSCLAPFVFGNTFGGASYRSLAKRSQKSKADFGKLPLQSLPQQLRSKGFDKTKKQRNNPDFLRNTKIMNKLNYLLLIVITCVLSFVRCTNNSAPPAFQTQNPDSIKITQKENESLGNLFDIVDSARLVRFEYEIDRIEQRYKFEKPAKNAILFVGSSSIRKWKTLEKDMKPLHVINHGFGGSTIPELLFYADRIIFPHKPKTIVFYAGDNDLGHKNAHPKMSLRLFKLFAQTVSERLPKTNIYFLSIKPSPRRKDFWDSMNNGNRLIKKYIDKQINIYFLYRC